MAPTGAQLFVAHHGTVVCDIALGDAVGTLMRVDTAHNLYCLSKPLTAFAMARLATDSLVALDAPLASLGLPEWAVPPFEATILDVLDHQLGLYTLADMEYRIAPLDHSTQLFAERIAGAQRSPGYSEILGGVILEEVIRSVTGDDPASLIESLVATSMGVGMSTPDTALPVTMALGPVSAMELARHGLVAAPVAGLPEREVPILFEMLERSFEYLRPAFGVLCAARSMGLFMEHVRQLLDSPEVGSLGSTLRTMFELRHAPFEDSRAKRTMTVAGGFMIDARANGFSTLASPRSLGHNAGIAQAVAFTDLDAELSISLYLNGAEIGESSVASERVKMVDLVYRGLGIDSVVEPI